MEATTALAILEAAGTGQTRKIYRRHGVSDPLHGVSFAELKRLRKQVGVDHDLALALWDSGNHDARMLATMVAEPARMGRRELDAWIRPVDNYVLSDAVADLVARTALVDSWAEKWTRSSREFVAHAGWALVAHQAMRDDDRPDAYFTDRLAQIEAGIAGAPNRTRHAMQMALIAIGGRTPGLRRRATALAKRIGTPAVDHGQTSCTTPDAIPYLDRMWERKLARSS